jgi:predicted flap endonuclease-1-like 5' DNA nuclease
LFFYAKLKSSFSEGFAMLYLLQQFWVFCLIAGLLGVIVSWLTRGDKVGASFWFNLLLILGVIGLIAALLFWLKGRGGLGLEIALLMLASYLVGCCIPCLLGCCGGKKAEAVGTTGRLMAARGGKGDDLTRLSGIDANRAAKLNGLGLYHFDQVCAIKDASERASVLKSIGLTDGNWSGWNESCNIKPLAVVAPVAQAVAAAVTPVVTKAAQAVAPEAVLEMPKVENQDAIAGLRPQGLTAARNNKADDLKRIRGIGPQNEGRLHGLGIWHFDQITTWTHDNIEWVGSYLAFPGRIDREDWVGQAKILAAGGMTDFSNRVDKGEVPTSKDDGTHGQSNVEIVKPH